MGPLARPAGTPGPSSRDFLRVGRDAADALTRSHLSDGRVVGWYGEPGVVIDAEIRGPVPPALARRFGEQDFWARWTQAECAAKLADVPVQLWISEHGLGPAGYEVETLELDDLVVSVCHRRAIREESRSSARRQGSST